ncbi:MAG: PspA/IM30 family protein [Acidobacteria bacterium]|nr:PspA/IM30 family protein [Acidobacteriota bacterium]MBI3654926.1 PspA/IM30 family protein [Acidobacteriota bacterium]
MSIFKRLEDIFKSNLNDLLDKAEDPAKMIHQIIREMKEQLVSATAEVNHAKADARMIQNQYDAERKKAEEWGKNAELAVGQNKDDMAREALKRQADHEKIAAGFKEQYDKQATVIAKLDSNLRALGEKIREAEMKQNLLIAREQTAKASKHVEEVSSHIGNTSAFEAMDRMERKVEHMEAEAEAVHDTEEAIVGDPLDKEFKKLKDSAPSDDVEQRLAALKSKKNPEGPKS